MDIGEKIAALRKTRAMTQADLGKELNVTFQAVSKWERGESSPDFATLSKIAKLFGVPLEYFEEGGENAQQEIAAAEEAKSEMLGICTVCGKAVHTGEEYSLSPVVCKACNDKKINEAEQKQLGEKQKQKAQQEYNRHKNQRRRNIGLITAACVSVALIIVMAVVWGMGKATFSGVGLCAYLIFTLFVFTFVSQLFWDGFVLDVLLFGCKIIGTPGVIFTLDLDGIIFLIGVKILFAVLKILVLLVLMLITTICAIIVSPFSFVPQLIKLNKGKEL